MNIIVGLGNPGEEYAKTRHNAGRICVEYFVKSLGDASAKVLKAANKSASKGTTNLVGEFEDLAFDKKYNALVAEGEIGSGKKKVKVLAVLPETFMNKSGKSLEKLVTSVKKASELIVVHDDLDMPIGKIKILFNRGSGGHKGVESIKRTIKTEAFARIKVGICPTTPSGKPKKPTGDKLLDFIVGEFKPAELDEIKKTAKRVAEAIVMMITESREKAMTEYNK